ncbi:MAG TPA: DUF748 domain-containing protein [Desulfobacterales bacterium]|nr:DUF748 domain-containing protein [Desulfobacterales bacterium]HIP38160.1 DUF748 domain-containing protein [Desulfocapsa sulfexigens]
MPDRYGSITIDADKSVSAPAKQNKLVSRKTDPPRKKEKKNSKSPVIAAIILFLLASYFLTTIYVVPVAIKKYLPQYVKNKTGLSLAIQKVQLNPVNYQLTLEQIEADIQEPAAASEALLQVKSIMIDFDLTSLIRNTFVCDRLTIKGLQLNLTRYKDKSYNIPALSRFSNAQQQGEIINFSSLPFLFSLNNIDITEGRILFEDQVTVKKHTVEQLQLAIPTLSNFSFQSKTYIQPHFSAIINGSHIQLSGKAEHLNESQGFQAQLSASIESLDLVPYFSYLPEKFPLTLLKGKANIKLQVSFAPFKKEGNRLSIDINLTAANVELQEKHDDFRISVPAMRVEAEYAPISRQLLFKSGVAKELHLIGKKEQVSAVIQKLFSRLQRKDTGRNKIDIDLLLIDQGRLTILDNEGKKTGNSQWDSLELTIKGYSSTKTSGTVYLSGRQAEDKGSFSWQGKFSDADKAHGKLLINDFPAAAFLDFLTPTAKESTEGTATFSGDLVLIPFRKQSVAYAVNNGMLQLQNLQLTHQNNTWLTADSVRFTRIDRIDGRYNLGNIFLKNSNLNLYTNKLPPLFTHLFSDQNGARIKGIDFSGNLHLTADTTENKGLEISKIRFQVNNLDKPAATDNFAFTGHLAQDGIIKAQGKLSFLPTKMQTSIAFSNVDTTLLAPFFSSWPLLYNSKATVHGKGKYSYPESSFQGNLRLTDTLLQNTPETPLTTWNLAEINNVACRFSPFSLTAETLHLNTPEVQWHREYISPFQQIQKGMRILFQDNSQKDTLFPIAIKKINFLNGSVKITDRRLSPVWSTTIDNLEGRINNLNTIGDGLSSFTITGITEDSPVTLSGAASFFRPNLDARARMKLTDFPLDSYRKQLKTTPVNPESATIDLHLDITENKTESVSNSQMIIRNLTPVSSNSDTALALAFLKDINGSFPMSIQMDNSGQSLFRESVASFKTTVIKASYAPLLLDPAFKDLQDNDTILFQPGTNQISSNGKEILRRYADLLNQHPELRLSLTGMADKKKDQEVLQKNLEDLEQKRIDRENEIRLEKYRKKQRESAQFQVVKSLQEEDIAKEDLAGYKPLPPKPVHVKKSSLVKLARERSLIVYDFCIHSLGVAVDRATIEKNAQITENAQSLGVQINIKTMETVLE